jgi:hypothetical protein
MQKNLVSKTQTITFLHHSQRLSPVEDCIDESNSIKIPMSKNTFLNFNFINKKHFVVIWNELHVFHYFVIVCYTIISYSYIIISVCHKDVRIKAIFIAGWITLYMHRFDVTLSLLSTCWYSEVITLFEMMAKLKRNDWFVLYHRSDAHSGSCCVWITLHLNTWLEHFHIDDILASLIIGCRASGCRNLLYQNIRDQLKMRTQRWAGLDCLLYWVSVG